MKRFVGVFLLSVLGAMIGGSLYTHFFQKKEVYYVQQPASERSLLHYVKESAPARPTVDQPLPNFVFASKQALPAVVHIKSNYSAKKNNPKEDFFSNPWHDYFDEDSYNAPRGTASGSGVILSEDGYIATNNHVVEDASKVEVSLYDNRMYEAKVIGTDVSTDLALLKIEEKDLPFLRFGNSNEVEIGQWVLAVGNPMDLPSTVTAGIVSAKGRNINLLRNDSDYAIESFIQTDAAVNRGNSGGALVNLQGELVGINTAIASRTGFYAGYSFAIPASIVQKVIEDLLLYGQVKRGLLGVIIQPVTARLVRERKLNVRKGAYITEVTPNSGAEKAGIKNGDIIVAINGVPISNSSELQEQVSRFRPGDNISVKLFRGKIEKNLSVGLRGIDRDRDFARRKVNLQWGDNEFRLLMPEEYDSYGVSYGIMLEEVNASLKAQGLKSGLLIMTFDGTTLRSIEQFEQLLDEAEGKVELTGLYNADEELIFEVEW